MWRKSSRSYVNSDCIEVANVDHAVAVRDSKSPAEGHLLLSNTRWKAITDRITQGDFDL